MNNKTIKFRAKNVLTKKWEYYTLQDLIDSKAKGIALDDWSQSTDLKDKNNKEIFEGDIIRGKFNLKEVKDYIYLNLTDKEKKEQSKLFIIEDIFYPYVNIMPNNLEIIGNIYDKKKYK